MAYPQDLSQYVYTPELGLQKEVMNGNIMRINGTSYLIKRISIKAGILNTKNTPVAIGNGIIIIRKTVGMPNVYIAKTKSFEVVDPNLDFSRKRFKIKGLTLKYNDTEQPYRLDKVSIKVSDTVVIESILNDFLSYGHGDVMTILKGITDSNDTKLDKLSKFMAVIESVIELGDYFHDVLTPFEETFLKAPEGLDTGDGKKPGTDDEKETTFKTTPIGEQKVTSKQVWTIIGLCAVAATYRALKKEKII